MSGIGAWYRQFKTSTSTSILTKYRQQYRYWYRYRCIPTYKYLAQKTFGTLLYFRCASNGCMDDCIACGKSSLLLTSDQQEHLLLLRGVDDSWTGHSSWRCSCISDTATHTRTHTHTHHTTHNTRASPHNNHTHPHTHAPHNTHTHILTHTHKHTHTHPHSRRHTHAVISF